ncbi:ABC transporter permease [Roseibacillus persicicus]|uniref:Oligopeptide transport system permease protein OppC n=1 Tax=Roseibacillus persicicus TaxID=454148 RepID=A0A918TJN1_9BACT|nr:ABC transporter permease [Roseibacillus persicicus]GHC50697.1 peptide ABC transporter permease [Roseibacillus persicicus]
MSPITETARPSSLPAAEKGSSLWSDAFVRLKKNKLAMVGGVVVLTILVACFIVEPILAATGMDGNEQDLSNQFAKPGDGSVLGTDQLGRDMLMRVLGGGQISLLVAILSTLVTVTIGIIYGGIAGYVGGRTEAIMMRIVDGLLAMPFLIIVILFRELISARMDLVSAWLVDNWSVNPDFVLKFSNLIPLIFAIAAFGWLTMGRIVRTAAASLRRQEFVEAARSLGLPHRRILFRHILPNMLGPVIIYATLTIPSFILYEATLSFIGLGIEPPNSSWGILIKEGANFLETYPVILAIPAAMFSITLFAFNFLGDGLRDALDPKSSKD